MMLKGFSRHSNSFPLCIYFFVSVEISDCLILFFNSYPTVALTSFYLGLHLPGDHYYEQLCELINTRVPHSNKYISFATTH